MIVCLFVCWLVGGHWRVNGMNVMSLLPARLLFCYINGGKVNPWAKFIVNLIRSNKKPTNEKDFDKAQDLKKSPNQQFQIYEYLTSIHSHLDNNQIILTNNFTNISIIL